MNIYIAPSAGNWFTSFLLIDVHSTPFAGVLAFLVEGYA
jgi:hypothetical protein